MTEAKQEAIANADAHLSNAALPTYSEISGALQSASLFFNELLNAFETLSGVGEQYGIRTLTDLLYLQNAIATSGKIDLWTDGESVIDKVVSKLPSADRWLAFVTVHRLTEQVNLQSY